MTVFNYFFQNFPMCSNPINLNLALFRVIEK